MIYASLTTVVDLIARGWENFPAAGPTIQRAVRTSRPTITAAMAPSFLGASDGAAVRKRDARP